MLTADVGTGDGWPVGIPVGPGVGTSVGPGVGAVEGSEDGAPVGSAVGDMEFGEPVTLSVPHIGTATGTPADGIPDRPASAEYPILPLTNPY